MSFKFTCPFCGQNMVCDDEMEGNTVNCPKCNEEIVPVREEADKPPQPDMPPPDREEKAKQRKAGENDTNTVSGAFHSWRDRSKVINEAPAPDSRLRKWVLGYVNRDGSFKNPLLSTIFYYAGIGFLVIAAIIVVVRIFLDIAESKCTNHPEGYITAAVFFADAFFNFGIAQVIHCIGKQAYNTDKIVELMTKTKERE